MSMETMPGPKSEKEYPDAMYMLLRLKGYGEEMNLSPDNAFFVFLRDAGKDFERTGYSTRLRELYDTYRDKIEEDERRRLSEVESGESPSQSGSKTVEVEGEVKEPGTKSRSLDDEMLIAAAKEAGRAMAERVHNIEAGRVPPRKEGPSSLERFGLTSVQVRRAARYIREFKLDHFQSMYWEWTHKGDRDIKPEYILKAENNAVLKACNDTLLECIENGSISRFKELANFLRGSWVNKVIRGSTVKLMSRADWLPYVKEGCRKLISDAIRKLDEKNFDNVTHCGRELKILGSGDLKKYSDAFWQAKNTGHLLKYAVLPSQRSNERDHVENVDPASGSMEKHNILTEQITEAVHALNKGDFKAFRKFMIDWKLRDRNLTSHDILNAGSSAIYKASAAVLEEGLMDLRNPKAEFSKRMRYFNSSDIDFKFSLSRDEQLADFLKETIERAFRNALLSPDFDRYINLLSCARKWKILSKDELREQRKKFAEARSVFLKKWGETRR